MPKRAVTAVDVVDDHADAVDVDDVREMRLFALHLQIDAVEVLLARDDARCHLRFAERLGQLAFDLAQQLALVALRAPQRPLEHLVAKRMKRLEPEVFELELDRVHAEPIRDRRIDVERLARDTALLLDRQRGDRAHVVRAVGELDEDDPQVLRHREQHLAEALGLRLRGAVELQVVDLADAVDQQRDVVAEPLLDLRQGARSVFYDVVQQRGLDGPGV